MVRRQPCRSCTSTSLACGRRLQAAVQGALNTAAERYGHFTRYAEATSGLPLISCTLSVAQKFDSHTQLLDARKADRLTSSRVVSTSRGGRKSSPNHLSRHAPEDLSIASYHLLSFARDHKFRIRHAITGPTERGSGIG